MNRSIFGWSYPPGCSGPPDDDVVEYQPLRCHHCKAFVGGTPQLVEWKSTTQCDGKVEDGLAACGFVGDNGHEPHEVVWDQGCNRVYTCKKCGHETSFGG